MSTTYPEAVDEMFSLLNTAWIANSAAIVGYLPELRWPNQEQPSTPDGSKFWGRVSQLTVQEIQTTLSDACGENGQKRYTASGLIFVQLFAPKSTASSADTLRNLAQMLKTALRGHTTSGKVWFRNAQVKELSAENQSWRSNVVAAYEYDEVG